MSDDWEAHEQRRRDLCERYGKPERSDTAAALRLLGKRIHPDEAIAFTYATREAAEAFAASNLEHGGMPSLGIAEHEGKWLGVIDLRGQPGRQQDRQRAAS